MMQVLAPNSEDRRPQQMRALVEAARRGESATVARLLDDPETAQYVTWAAYAAVDAGALDVVKVMVEKCGPSVLHDRQHLALRLAARRGDEAMFDLLADYGALLGARNSQGLALAALRRHDGIIEGYLKRGFALLRKEDMGDGLEQVGRRVSGPITFLHIAKTSGTSLGALLRQAFPVCDWLHYEIAEAMAEPLAPSYCWWRHPVAKALGELSPQRQASPIVISGHFTYRLRESLPPSRLFVSMIRDPVERAISLYYYHFVRRYPELKDVPIEKFLDSEEGRTRYGWLFQDHQVRVLSGSPVLDPDQVDLTMAPAPVREADTNAALSEAQENFILLGLTENYVDSIIVLARQLGLPLTAMLGKQLNRNESRPRGDAISQATRDYLAGLNRQDLRLHAGAKRLLDSIIDEDRTGFERDRDLFDRLKSMYDERESYPRLLAYERAARGRPAPRLFYLPSRPLRPLDADRVRAAYLDLLEDVLIDQIYQDPSMAPWNRGCYNPQARQVGSDWPSRAHSMIGKLRMQNVRQACEQAVVEGVGGDFLEAGVWRGGTTIMMRAVLQAHADRTRTVWVADSFTGVPPPDDKQYPADRGDLHYTATEYLAISQSEVAENFRRYGLLDRQVRFLPGLFKDTLPGAPIDCLSVLRLDGDLFESTMDTLRALYDKVSPGGFIIVDDYGAVPGCRVAVDEFRSSRSIDVPLVPIDWAGVYWRKV